MSLEPLYITTPKSNVDDGTLDPAKINLYNDIESVLNNVPEGDYPTTYIYKATLNPDVHNAPPLFKQVSEHVKNSKKQTISELLEE